MIADDDDDLLYLLKTQLASTGYTVNTCPDGNSLMKKLIAEKPNIVLLDINMKEVDGEKLCSEIKKDKRLSGVKVLLMSGQYDIKKISSSCGADGYITKSLSYPTIESKISLMFSEH